MSSAFWPETWRPARLWRAIAELLALAVLPASLAAFCHPYRPSWDPEAVAQGEVRLATVRGWETQKAKVLWVDARSREAYEKRHVPGALLLNEDDWNGLLGALIERWEEGTRLVVYCSIRSCAPSQDVARRLCQETGLPEVYILKGGWEAWLNERR